MKDGRSCAAVSDASSRDVDLWTGPRALSMLLFYVLAPLALNVLPDGRTVHILKHDAAVAKFIQDRVVTLANAAIAEKGSFTMSIGSGTTVKPLVQLEGECDWSKVHLFFGNDRTEGDAAGKCFEGAQDFITACGIPASNVHRAPVMPAEESAAAYEAELRACEVVGTNDISGLPSLDLVLLGSGADAHCASLYPERSVLLPSHLAARASRARAAQQHNPARAPCSKDEPKSAEHTVWALYICFNFG